jgi:hypothetical protein
MSIGWISPVTTSNVGQNEQTHPELKADAGQEMFEGVQPDAGEASDASESEIEKLCKDANPSCVDGIEEFHPSASMSR